MICSAWKGVGDPTTMAPTSGSGTISFQSCHTLHNNTYFEQQKCAASVLPRRDASGSIELVGVGWQHVDILGIGMISGCMIGIGWIVVQGPTAKTKIETIRSIYEVMVSNEHGIISYFEVPGKT